LGSSAGAAGLPAAVDDECLHARDLAQCCYLI
jgi:hypothetical protein